MVDHIHSTCVSIAGLVQDTKNRYFDIPISEREAKPQPNKWSKKEILGHLIDSARYNLMRFTEATLTEQAYLIHSYPQDHLVKTNQYQYQKEEDLITQWIILNKQIILAISRLTILDGERKVIVHQEEKNLTWLIDDYVSHMQHHLNQIFDVSSRSLITPYGVSMATAIQTHAENQLIHPSEFSTFLSYAGLEVEYYQPIGIDKQLPHRRDEIYVIVSGHGSFRLNDRVYPFKDHDILFVKAGERHQFVDFSSDFATWVIFYGLETGV